MFTKDLCCSMAKRLKCPPCDGYIEPCLWGNHSLGNDTDTWAAPQHPSLWWPPVLPLAGCGALGKVCMPSDFLTGKCIGRRVKWGDIMKWLLLCLAHSISCFLSREEARSASDGADGQGLQERLSHGGVCLCTSRDLTWARWALVNTTLSQCFSLIQTSWPLTLTRHSHQSWLLRMTQALWPCLTQQKRWASWEQHRLCSQRVLGSNPSSVT